MFDGIARRYDLLNHLLSLGIDRGWRRRVVRMVRLHRPAEILDMATGTGDLAIMLAEACPAAQITGIDLSERMLAIGREKVERKGLSGRIRLSQGDAETPRYGEGRFDAATVAFGVRNFEDLPGGMTGLYRALKPGGRLYVLEFDNLVNVTFVFHSYTVSKFTGRNHKLSSLKITNKVQKLNFRRCLLRHTMPHKYEGIFTISHIFL